ncbi:MAG: glycoside hydrolase family 104 protein [Pseudomonadota bacterium]
MIGVSEGTSTCKATKHDGYDVIVGGGTFTDFSNHPHILVKLNDRLSSTAAGRYQLLGKYFDAYKVQLSLHDFSPASQDAIALQQIKECHALEDIEAGRFTSAVQRCAHIWASLPGANYGQHENKIEALKTAYTNAGGLYVA